MAKIFSNISKTSTNLTQKYNNSTVTPSFNTFIRLRTDIGSSLSPSTILVTNRPKKVYDNYTDPVTISTPLVERYQESVLITEATVIRSRRTPFYNGFRSANPYLTTTNAPQNGTLIEIKPYTNAPLVGQTQVYSVETEKMLQNSQALPLVSGPRDVKRITDYLRTNEGKQFKILQSILQAGSTFGQSRAYNPVSTETMVGNYSVSNLYNPLIRVSRLIEGTAITDVGLQGRLQRETVLDSQSRLKLKFVGGQAPRASGIQTATQSALDTFIQNRINTINIRIGGSTFNIGQIGRSLDQLSAQLERGRAALNINNATLVKDQTAYDALYLNNLWPLMKENNGTIQNFSGQQETYIQKARAAIRVEKGSSINKLNTFTEVYPETSKIYRSAQTYTEDVRASQFVKTRNGITITTYVQDKFNIQGTDGRVTDISQLERDDKDYVTFKIMVPTVFDTGIKFRAFIQDINHNAKGEYEDVRYVGRPERFITYRGMNRSLTLSMYLIAFSQPELDAIWLRASMLNKLVYPVDVANGFMVPPLARLTIGNVIQDQYGYVENVSMQLQDIPWDIDRELPMAIKLNMTYNIIENKFITQKSQTGLFASEITQQTFAAVMDLNRGPQADAVVSSTAVASAVQPAPAATPAVTTTDTSRPPYRVESLSPPGLFTGFGGGGGFSGGGAGAIFRATSQGGYTTTTPPFTAAQQARLQQNGYNVREYEAIKSGLGAELAALRARSGQTTVRTP